MSYDDGQDIRDRTFTFACDVVRYAVAIAPRAGVRVLVDQLVRAGTSVGANLEEAKAASTRREFLRGIEIATREAREALYWLRLCAALDLGRNELLRPLEKESDQIVRILTTIGQSTKRGTGVRR